MSRVSTDLLCSSFTLLLACLGVRVFLQEVWAFLMCDYWFLVAVVLGAAVIGVYSALKHISLPLSSSADRVLDAKTMVIAHRGGGLDAPENSIAAFRNCSRLGCTHVELDVALTKDDVAVLFHDDTVDRLTDGEGLLTDLTYNEVQKLTLKDPTGRSDEHERIPKLTDGIDECLKLGLKVIIDVKTPDMKIVNKLLDLFKQRPELYDSAAVSSFFPHIIYKVRQEDPGIVGCMAYRPHFLAFKDYSGIRGQTCRRYPELWKHCLALVCDWIMCWAFFRVILGVCGLSGALLHREILTPELLRFFQDREVRLMAWTVNDPIEKRYISQVLKIPYLTDSVSVSASDM